MYDFKNEYFLYADGVASTPEARYLDRFGLFFNANAGLTPVALKNEKEGISLCDDVSGSISGCC